MNSTLQPKDHQQLLRLRSLHLAARARQQGRTAPAAKISRRILEQEKEFWNKLSNVVDGKMFRVYTALEKHLAAYHKLLQERAAALQEVSYAVPA